MEKFNIIAPVGLIFGWELGTVSSNTVYYIFIPSGFNTNKLTAWGGENLHRPTEEALLPINNHYKMSRKPEDMQYNFFP